jgi:biopolymer transport protein ExbD
MAIQTRNKKSIAFSTASMSDLVFLLLIFFILISTLVNPNAIDVSLPSSHSKTVSPKGPVVAIDRYNNYYYYSDPVDLVTLQGHLAMVLSATDGTTGVELQADRQAEVQSIVNIYNIVSLINTQYNSRHKVILKTAPNP